MSHKRVIDCDHALFQSLVDIVADTVNQSSHTNLSARKSDGDADTMIVTTAVELASSGENVLILADDSDILFLCLAQSNTENLFLKQIGQIYDIDKTKKSMPAEIAEYILVLHGLFGCDTTSGFYQRHSIFSTKWASVTEHLRFFVKNDSSKEEIEAAGQALIAHRYNYELPLNTARKKLYNSKCTTAKKNMNLASLPPIEDAVKLHSLRAYHQIQEWLPGILYHL